MLNNSIFLLQIAAIVGFSRLVALAFRKFGQPQVVGEMAAGIALGPTFLGSIAPGVYQTLFPIASLTVVNALSQAGLTIFIFLVGLRVDFAELSRHSKVALITSATSVVLPLLMGASLAQYLFPRYGHGDRLTFSLFIGTAMSITAFPVLAHILMERNWLGTRLGTMAIACAAFDDITAWILLATIIARIEHGQSTRPLWLMFFYLAVYLIIMLVLKNVLYAWSKRFNTKKVSLDVTVIFVILAFVSGAAGEWIGIHSLVGAFLAGLITPRTVRHQLIDKFEVVTVLFLIPLFFALTGIRTNLIFKLGSGAYLDLLFILLVAVASKWGATMLGSRATGMKWRDACQLGLLMNTRGLVELIVLNVGLDKGILTPTLFSIMVCMALVTTFMATPFMNWFEGDALQLKADLRLADSA